MIENSLSRRSFLAGAGIVTGAAVVAAGTGLIKPKSAEAAFTAFPWPYPAGGLNVATVKQRGYEDYYDFGGCMSGTGKGMVRTLIEALGAGTAWDSVPQDMFTYGGGGVSSWGTVCGALHGASYVIAACAANGTDATNLIDTLYQWYCGFAFPTTDHDGYLRSTGISNQPTSVCNSPLCHASVSTWCTTHGKTVGSYDKKDRCAKVAGDVAGKTAELLNAYKAGTFTTVFTQPDTTCSGCHVTGGTEKWVQMKADCDTCHGAGKNTVPPGGSMCTRPQ